MTQLTCPLKQKYSWPPTRRFSQAFMCGVPSTRMQEWLYQWSFFHFFFCFFWILWSYKYIFWIININIFQGDLSSISAKTAALDSILLCTRSRCFVEVYILARCNEGHLTGLLYATWRSFVDPANTAYFISFTGSMNERHVVYTKLLRCPSLRRVRIWTSTKHLSLTQNRIESLLHSTAQHRYIGKVTPKSIIFQ